MATTYHFIQNKGDLLKDFLTESEKHFVELDYHIGIEDDKELDTNQFFFFLGMDYSNWLIERGRK